MRGAKEEYHIGLAREISFHRLTHFKFTRVGIRIANIVTVLYENSSMINRFDTRSSRWVSRFQYIYIYVSLAARFILYLPGKTSGRIFVRFSAKFEEN